MAKLDNENKKPLVDKLEHEGVKGTGQMEDEKRELVNQIDKLELEKRKLQQKIGSFIIYVCFFI